MGATVFALACPALQAASGWGLSASEFAADGNGTLRAAGYAFSIWSVIYAGIAATVVVALAVLRRTRLAIYGVPVAWGLVAVFVAERARHEAPAWSALAAAAIVLLAAGACLRRPSAARR